MTGEEGPGLSIRSISLRAAGFAAAGDLGLLHHGQFDPEVQRLVDQPVQMRLIPDVTGGHRLVGACSRIILSNAGSKRSLSRARSTMPYLVAAMVSARTPRRPAVPSRQARCRSLLSYTVRPPAAEILRGTSTTARSETGRSFIPNGPQVSHPGEVGEGGGGWAGRGARLGSVKTGRRPRCPRPLIRTAEEAHDVAGDGLPQRRCCPG